MTRLKRLLSVIVLVLVLLTTFGAGWIVGTTGMGSTIDPATLPERERQFAERMKAVALVGVFTVEAWGESGAQDFPFARIGTSSI